MKHLFIALLLIISVSTFAQTIVGCSDYDKKTGKPSGIYNSWDIKSDGGYVYLLYSQPQVITKQLTLYVDKKNNSGKYIAYATEYFNTSASLKQKWSVYDFKFTESGEYKITVLADGNELASTFQTINYAAGEGPKNSSNSSSSNNNSSSNKSSSSTSNSDDYDDIYIDSKVLVAEDVDEDINPIGEATTFYAQRDGKKPLKIIVKNTEAFATDLFYIDIYYYENDEKDEKLLETVEVEVQDDWVIMAQPYTFPKRGHYFIDVYNEYDEYVNSVTIEIK